MKSLAPVALWIVSAVLCSSTVAAEADSLIETGPSPECVVAWHSEAGTVLICSSAERNRLWGDRRGSLMWHDVSDLKGRFRELSIRNAGESGLKVSGNPGGARPFEPLGLCVQKGVFAGRGSTVRVYATNSGRGGRASTIEVFRLCWTVDGVPELCWEDAVLGWNSLDASGGVELLSHWRKLHKAGAAVAPKNSERQGSNFLKLVNSIAVTSDGILFATNTDQIQYVISSGVTKVPVATTEDGCGATDRDTVVVCRPGKAPWKVAAHHVGGANGLVADEKRQRLYAAAYLRRSVHVFHLPRGSLDLTVAKDSPGSLPPQQLDFHPDNLSLDRDSGNICIAGQPAAWAVVGHGLTRGLLRCGGGYAEVRPEDGGARCFNSPRQVPASSNYLKVGGARYLSGLFKQHVMRLP